MILTNLNDSQKNKTLNEKIQKCIEYVKNNDILSFETGVYEIEDGIKMNYDNYSSKEEKDGLWESHIKYLDVQVMLDGEEYIAVNNIKNMKKKSKDQKNDIIFFIGDELFKIPLKKDDILILYPEDVHMPGLKIRKSILNKKVVFKIEISKM